jgi:hypothetical protein
MAGITRIDDERAAAALADLLNGNKRTRPIVVITIPVAGDRPWIDAETVVREAGDLADVFLMPTNAISWEFSRRMPEGTQVYGGAGRVYPVGHEWLTDLARSPLRLVWSEQDAEKVTRQLISDMFRMAAASGLLQAQSTRALRPVDAVVKGIVAGRALVDVGNALPATIAEELTVEDVPITRLVSVGQRIKGSYDPDTNRVDVRRSLVRAAQALSGYAIGDVILASVQAVQADSAEVMLYPKTLDPAVVVSIGIADVTTNPFDDLRTLMSVGEVVSARVTATGPTWALSMSDVDDDEPVVAAPALLPGGPPWLVDEGDEDDEPQPDDGAVLPTSVPAPESDVTAGAGAWPNARPTASRMPLPAVALTGVQVATAEPHVGESARDLLPQIADLSAQVSRLKAEVAGLSAQRGAECAERHQLRSLLDEAERRANRAENELKSARSRLRKASRAKASSAPGEGPRFADREQGFRYLVLTQWATRTIPSEQAQRPLPDYLIGPDFLDSLEALEGVRIEKVADVVFEIVTGRAPHIVAREVHRFRSGTGGEDQVRTREDGAVAWRASLQTNSASARRIHYWVLPNGQFEFARVVLHDDFDM